MNILKAKNFFVISLQLILIFNFLLTPVLAAEGLQNPLGDINDPRVIIGNVIKAVLGIIGSLALAVFILGGFYWVTSAGNEEKVKKGKDMIIWAVFGLTVIFASYAIVTFVIGALTGDRPIIGSTPNPAGPTPNP